MSGHSKWHNIKLRKGKVDAQRGQLFTKLSKEIIIAARAGLPDPEANFSLKIAVGRARDANMPMDNIKRAIARASGEGKGDDYEEIRYEGYGPGGVAVIVEAVTDNRNRTASEMRYIFSRNGGNLGETGSVGWLFDERGVISLPVSGIGEEELLEAAVIDGVIDVQTSGDIGGDHHPAGRVIGRARSHRTRAAGTERQDGDLGHAGHACQVAGRREPRTRRRRCCGFSTLLKSTTTSRTSTRTPRSRMPCSKRSHERSAAHAPPAPAPAADATSAAALD